MEGSQFSPPTFGLFSLFMVLWGYFDHAHGRFRPSHTEENDSRGLRGEKGIDWFLPSQIFLLFEVEERIRFNFLI